VRSKTGVAVACRGSVVGSGVCGRLSVEHGSVAPLAHGLCGAFAYGAEGSLGYAILCHTLHNHTLFFQEAMKLAFVVALAEGVSLLS